MFKYRPLTMVEGDDFCERYCDHCEHDREFRETGQNGCEILANSIIYKVHDEKYPKEWCYKKLIPTCTAFTMEKKKYRCDRTVDIFD